MKKNDLIFFALFIGIILLFCLMGCQTVPEAPQRNEELLRQCAKINDNRAQKLFLSLKKGKAPPEQQDDAQVIYETSEAMVSWIGHPEKEFTSNPKHLIKKMSMEDYAFDRELEKWSHEVAKFEGETVGGFWGNLTFMGTIIIAAVLALVLILIVLGSKFV